MKVLKLNSDVGEGAKNEKDIFPYLFYCNIACGGHIGTINSMTEMVTLALENKVLIGAHPSYPDKENFGRKSMNISEESLINSIRNQINALKDITTKLGTSIHHIKPHGALYNDISKDEIKATLFLKAILPFKDSFKLLIPNNSIIEQLALKNGFSIVREAFADRNYNNDLSLVSRDNENALISDKLEMINHVKLILNTSQVKTINNQKLKLVADTFCIHSDTPKALELIKAVHGAV
ncbi:MAG: lactam utilization protein LamB [Bacteroidetes bacterium MedPE-SWsnd-G1]|nr:MAG: lactam utilization protein LamB [Bacteroidetes bacterium MedPE-SWsnd-G1]